MTRSSDFHGPTITEADLRTFIAVLSTVADQMKERQVNDAHLFVSHKNYGIIWDDGAENFNKMAFSPSFMQMGEDFLR